MNRQLQGLEDLEGTYPFDLRLSVQALRINRFFWELRRAENRQAFMDNALQAMQGAKLSEHEQALILNRDWIGLVRYGVNFFVLEKLARVLRLSNLEVYAAMRGETLEAFLQTRRVPDAR